VLASCGAKPSAPAHPDGDADGHQASGSGLRPDGSGSEQTQPIDSHHDDKCDRLLDRVVTLAVAERPAEQIPTNEERAAIVTQLRASWSPKCEAMTSKGFDCALRAPTLADVDRCGG